MESRAIVIVNSGHKLFKEQQQLLDEGFQWETLDVPAEGWSLDEMKEVKSWIVSQGSITDVVFVSPVPFLLKTLTANSGKRVWVFHNDTRKAKELPGGRIVHVVSETGWKIV